MFRDCVRQRDRQTERLTDTNTDGVNLYTI